MLSWSWTEDNSVRLEAPDVKAPMHTYWQVCGPYWSIIAGEHGCGEKGPREVH